jgi:hypothetical protein
MVCGKVPYLKNRLTGRHGHDHRPAGLHRGGGRTSG